MTMELSLGISSLNVGKHTLKSPFILCGFFSSPYLAFVVVVLLCFFLFVGGFSSVLPILKSPITQVSINLDVRHMFG